MTRLTLKNTASDSASNKSSILDVKHVSELELTIQIVNLEDTRSRRKDATTSQTLGSLVLN